MRRAPDVLSSPALTTQVPGPGHRAVEELRPTLQGQEEDRAARRRPRQEEPRDECEQPLFMEPGWEAWQEGGGRGIKEEVHKTRTSGQSRGSIE